MLKGQSTISAFTPGNLIIWTTLAFQAGALNAGGFVAFRSFVSHVTGFATLVGFEIVRGDLNLVAGLTLAPLAFLVGAGLSGLLIDRPMRLGRLPRYRFTLALIFALLLLAYQGGRFGWFGTFGRPILDSREYALLGLLSLICGLQNGMVTLVSRSVVRTTHLTGIATDLGIGLVRVLGGVGGRGRGEEAKAIVMRVALIVGFTAGAATGAYVFRGIGWNGFAVPLAITGGLWVTFSVARRLRAT